MPVKTSALKQKTKLLKHYQKNQKVALLALEEEDAPLEEFCWMALSWRTTQMVTDIGQEAAAKMFDKWVAEIRAGRFGEFDGTQMSKLEDLEESLIY